MLAQDRVRIFGTVSDALTVTPLAYASVTIKGKTLGTITNEDGQFELIVPVLGKTDSVAISYLGYKTSMVSSSESPLHILLTPEPIALNAVEVTNKDLTAREIVLKALERIEDNYPVTPYMLKGFYRAMVTSHDTIAYVLEAAMNIHDNGYKAPRKKLQGIEETIEVNAIRSTGRNSNFGLPWLDDVNMLSAMLQINNVRYRNVVFDGRNHWKYTLDGITSYQGRSVYIIRSGTDWTFRLFIDQENFRVYKVAVAVDNFPDWKFTPASSTMDMRTVRFVKTVEFREYTGKLFLNYINYEERVEFREKKSGNILKEVVFHEDISVSEAVLNPSDPDPKKILNSQVILDKQISEYDDNFWKRYNKIKELPNQAHLAWLKK